MSERTLRLCDKRGCNMEFETVCMFCDVDCCSGHIGENVIQVELALRRSTPSHPERLGGVVFKLCKDCCAALARAAGLVEIPPAGFAAPVAETIKAYMVANGLAKKGSA